MIDDAGAKIRAEAFLKCPGDDPDHPWSIESFPQGWLIRQAPVAGAYGQPAYVIERETGRIVSFPSSVPPRRIREDYASVVSRATVEPLPG